jgi:uncharacterized membrane protein YeaQ/YmgE (transglycosylase-associated protein family)
MIVTKRAQGLVGDLLLGVIGALVAGGPSIGAATRASPVTTPDSVLASAVGAIVVLVVSHAFQGARSSA